MRKALAVISLLIVPGVSLADGSPWLPFHGGTDLSLTVISGTADRFFINEDSSDIQGDITGTFVWLNASYGYDDIWAFDFRTGYAESAFELRDAAPGFTQEPETGVNDTTFGVRYQFINELEADNGLPTITGRIAYTFGGDYETDVIEAIGDGASGFDLSLLVGKSLTRRVSLFGDLTYRQRDDRVADAVKFLIGTSYATPVQGLTVNANYGLIRTDSEVDIFDEGFSVEDFPLTNRDQDVLILGGNYGFSNGLNFGLAFQNLLSGRNVPDTNVISVSAGYSF